jgi:hypothetical protein
MNARSAVLLASLTLAFAPVPALAQAGSVMPAAAQNLPPGFTVQRSAGGYEAAPPPGSLPPDAPAAASSLSSTASGELGPQQHLGMALTSNAYYVFADIIAPPIVYSAFTPVTRGYDFGSYAARAAAEFGSGPFKVMIGADARRYSYPSAGGRVTGLAGQGTGTLPSFDVREYQVDERAGLLLIEPRIYVAVSYLQMGTNANAPPTRGLGTASRSSSIAIAISRCTAACTTTQTSAGTTPSRAFREHSIFRTVSFAMRSASRSLRCASHFCWTWAS